MSANLYLRALSADIKLHSVCLYVCMHICISGVGKSLCLSLSSAIAAMISRLKATKQT